MTKYNGPEVGRTSGRPELLVGTVLGSLGEESDEALILLLTKQKGFHPPDSLLSTRRKGPVQASKGGGGFEELEFQLRGRQSLAKRFLGKKTLAGIGGRRLNATSYSPLI